VWTWGLSPACRRDQDTPSTSIVRGPSCVLGVIEGSPDRMEAGVPTASDLWPIQGKLPLLGEVGVMLARQLTTQVFAPCFHGVGGKKSHRLAESGAATQLPQDTD
jgi:hypothetical protein